MRFASYPYKICCNIVKHIVKYVCRFQSAKRWCSVFQTSRSKPDLPTIQATIRFRFAWRKQLKPAVSQTHLTRSFVGAHVLVSLSIYNVLIFINRPLWSTFLAAAAAAATTATVVTIATVVSQSAHTWQSADQCAVGRLIGLVYARFFFFFYYEIILSLVCMCVCICVLVWSRKKIDWSTTDFRRIVYS